jgi:sugar phosphate permease
MKKYYPWLMAVLAGITLMISNGMSITGLSVFDESLLQEFGWDRGGLKFRDMVTFLVTGLTAPLIGVCLDRYGVRACMMVGWVVLALAYFFYSHIESLSQLYMVHMMLGIVLVLCGLNAAVILVSHWFVAKRGTAIGIALVGTSMGGAILPQFGNYMNETYGWRTAFQSEIIFPLILLVLTVLVIRNRPEDMGMEPVGGRERSGGDDAPVEGVEYLDALKTKTFWALATIAMTTFYTVLGAQAHLFLYMRDLNHTPDVATNAISLFFICALVGKFVFGMLADYLDRMKVFVANLVVMLSGAVCLALIQPSLLWVAIVTFGLGWGGVYTMLQLSAMSCFGLKSAGKILGTITVMDALGGGLGIWLTGVFYEAQGSYELAYQVFAGLILVALFCVFHVKAITPAQTDNVAAPAA